MGILNALEIKVPHIQLLSTGLVLSQLSVDERERIFSCIYQLLNIPQIRFIEIAHSLKMNRTSFWDKRCRIPKILQPLERQLDKVSRKYLLIKRFHIFLNLRVKSYIAKDLEIKAKIS